MAVWVRGFMKGRGWKHPRLPCTLRKFQQGHQGICESRLAVRGALSLPGADLPQFPSHIQQLAESSSWWWNHAHLCQWISEGRNWGSWVNWAPRSWSSVRSLLIATPGNVWMKLGITSAALVLNRCETRAWQHGQNTMVRPLATIYLRWNQSWACSILIAEGQCQYFTLFLFGSWDVFNTPGATFMLRCWRSERDLFILHGGTEEIIKGQKGKDSFYIN